MIVSRGDFIYVVKQFSKPGQYGTDTETTGLRRKDRLFSLILADERQGYYFNFNDKPDHLGNRAPEEYVLPHAWLEDLQAVFDNPESLFFFHNAKFDLGMLAKEGLSVLGSVHCTEAMERVLCNNLLSHKPYSLKSCAQRRGLAKDDAVEAYIKKHKLVTKIRVPGKAKLFEEKHFDLVPFDIIAPYGCTDAVLSRTIGLDQIAKLKEQDETTPAAPSRLILVENERKFTKAAFRMEEFGAHIDRAYTQNAYAHTQKEIQRARIDFANLTGREFEDSSTMFKSLFPSLGIELPKTRTGQLCTNKVALDAVDHPVAAKIREIRTLEKLNSTYYSSFLYFADENDNIHANMRQGGTETSRLSYSDPNLQNMPKEDEPEDATKPFLVRRCFTPLNDDYCLVPVDYRQQEFRLMLDYAGQTDLIEQVLAGVDVHDATAVLMGVTRKKAKTLNFGLLYGMGAAKLAKALGISLQEAYELRNLYFQKLPKVRRFIQGVMKTGEARGFIWNWFGFRNYIASPEWAYILPNHLIQGGCGQVIRIATVRLDAYMRKHQLRSFMSAQVHDEILFQVHKSEFQHIPEFQRIMEGIYQPRNGMRLDCSVEHSFKSYAKWDQTKGLPSTRAKSVNGLLLEHG